MGGVDGAMVVGWQARLAADEEQEHRVRKVDLQVLYLFPIVYRQVF